MKQKTVIQTNLSSEEKRRKALDIVLTKSSGIIDCCGVEGRNRDQLVMVGDNMDSASVVSALRKKFGYARIVTVEEVETTKKMKKEQEDYAYGKRNYCGCSDFPNPNPNPQVIYYGTPDPSPSCSIM